MRDTTGCLAQKQAFLGVHPRDPTAGGVAGDRLVIAFGVVAEEREVESVLPVGPAVATPRVTTGAGQDRNDVLAEVPGATGRVVHDDRDDRIPGR